MMQRRFLAGLIVACGAALGACSARESASAPARAAVLIGIDGASWNAIRELWERGQLPHLKRLAATGVAADLKPVATESPVIWTSIATGVRPERHGITNFVVPTAAGDLPVSSRVRRVPALWNMVTTAGRRVAALGWWASWPAETVNGVVVSDRALRGVENAFYPPEFALRFQTLMTTEADTGDGPPQSVIARQDRALAAVARQLVGEDFDLLMVYFRNVDAESHRFWKYFLPKAVEDVGREDAERFGERVPAAYSEVDRVIGDLVERVGDDANVFVVSDHGFRAVKREQYRIHLSLDRILEHLGYLARRDGAIDWSTTRASSWDSAPGMRIQLVRIALDHREPSGAVRAEDLQRERDRLMGELAEITFESGAPAFRVREPKPAELERGADLTVVIQQRDVSRRLLYRGETIPDAVRSLHAITGTHDANTEGVFLAAGPDIEPGGSVALIHSLDVAPTLLYAMSLPVAEDFDGQPWLALFSPEFRRRHPVRTIPSWGAQLAADPAASSADEELLEELRALGYLD